MALTLFSDITSLTAQRHLSRTQGDLFTRTSRLSSGMRINSAADDAAGLALSERLRARVRGVAQAERNANDGISLLQTADGALNEISGVLTRMRELAVQAATGTLVTSDRGYLNQEFVSLRSEIDRLASSTEFNGRVLLSGNLTNLQLQVGIGTASNDRLTVTISSVRSSNIGSTTTLDAVTLTDIAAARTAIGVIDAAVRDVSTQRGRVGSYQNRLAYSVSSLLAARESFSTANSRIRDVDVADESAALTRSQILTQAGVAVLTQANQNPAVALQILK